MIVRQKTELLNVAMLVALISFSKQNTEICYNIEIFNSSISSISTDGNFRSSKIYTMRYVNIYMSSAQ